MELYVLMGIATVLWGSFGVVEKIATTKADATVPPNMVVLQMVLVENAFWFAIMPGCAMYLLWQNPAWHPHLAVLGWGALTMCALVASIVFYLRALAVAEASWVIGLTAASPIVTQVLGFVVHESLSGLRLAATLVAVLGALLLSFEKQDGLSRRQQLQCLGNVLLATIFGGALFISDKAGVNLSSPIELSFSVGVWGVLIWLVVFMVARHYLGCGFHPFRGPVARYASCAAMMQGAGNLAYIIAMALAAASYIVPMTLSLDQIVVVLMSRFLLKEKIKAQRVLGIFLIVAGAMGIQAAGLS